MTTKTRLAALEKTAHLEERERIFCHIAGEEFGMCNGVKMTPAQFEAEERARGRRVQVINVGFHEDHG